MTYTTNPAMPRLRARAVEMVREGKSVSEVAKYFGYTKGAVSKWCKKCPANGTWAIPTESSRPKTHPRAVEQAIVDRIKELRIAFKGRCGEVIHDHLKEEGLKVGLRTVYRVLDRSRLLKKRSPWKRLHKSITRPLALKPGDLVQIDTIHLMDTPKTRIYIYTLIDVFSRWAFAWATARANTRLSIKFLKLAQEAAPFTFSCIQSDNGPEFSQHFTERIKITHRHSRIRKPNDNAHLERFNRTIQDELLQKLPADVRIINKHLPNYLNYYNTQRKHLGLELKTPAAVTNCFQGIG